MGQLGIVQESGSAPQRSPEPAKVTCHVIFITAIAVIGGFLFGYDCGVVAGAMLIIKTYFKLNDRWQELIVSSTVVAAAVFAAAGGYLNDKFGRKRTIFFSSLLFGVGAAVMAFAGSKEVLLVGRVIVGAGVGTSSCVIPAYIAEVTPPAVRGRMLVTFQLMITLGFWVAGLLNAGLSYIKDDNLNWRLMVGIAGIPPLIQLLGLSFLPESPRWLAVHNYKEKAESVLSAIYGGDEDAKRLAQFDVQQMIKDQKKTRTETEAKGGSNVLSAMLKTYTTRKALVIGCLLQMFQQLCGINTVMYYSASIIQSGGIRSRTVSIWMTSVTSGVNFFCTFIGIYLVERLGRRRLLLYSTLGVTLSCFLLGVGFVLISANALPATYDELAFNFTPGYHRVEDLCKGLGCDGCSYMVECGFCFEEGQSMASSGSCVPIFHNASTESMSNYGLYGRCAPNFSMLSSDGDYLMANPSATFDYGYCITQYSWLPILGMIVYLSSFSVGLGPIPWTVNAEIYPTWARSIGNSVSTFTNWTFNIIISFTFLTLSRAITREGAFFLYGSVCLIGLAVFYLLVPETKGMRIEDIEDSLRSSWIYKDGRSDKRPMHLNTVYPATSIQVAYSSTTPELTTITSL